MRRLLILLCLIFSVVLTGCGDTLQGCIDGKCYIDNKAFLLEFQLKGSESIQLPLNGTYEEKGVMILVDDQDMSEEVTIIGVVDTATHGIYELKYFISVNGKSYSKKRTVEVLEESVIDFYLLGSTEVVLEYGEKYTEDSYVAINNYTNENLYLDVSIIGKVDSRTAGTYVLVYKLEYYSYTMELERVVIVQEYSDFEFELKNDENVYVFYGQSYIDDGVLVAYDNLDRINYIDKLSVVSNVDINTPGIYSVVYSITVQGVFYELVRTVEVVSDVMTFELNGEEVVYLNLGEAFVDPGATFYLNGEVFWDSEFDMSHQVDVNTPGTYTLEYKGTLYTSTDTASGKYNYYAVRTVIVS